MFRKVVSPQNHTFHVARPVTLRKITSSFAAMSSKSNDYRLESDAFGPIKVESTR